MALIVNLEEFSELCGVTGETMRGYIRTVEGNPPWLLKKGDRGRGYEIEPVGGLEWWKTLRQDEETASAERQEALRQLRFEHLGEAAETTEAMALSGKQRREEYAAVMERIKLRKTMGELVEVAEIVERLTAAAVEARRTFQVVPAEFAALMGMSPEEVAPLATLIEAAVNKFVDAITGAPDGLGPDA